MKRFSQTLRISLALFLAMFSTSALPTASAYALEDVIAEQAVTEPTEAVEIPPAEPVVEDAIDTPGIEVPVVENPDVTPAEQIVQEVPFEAPQLFAADNSRQAKPDKEKEEDEEDAVVEPKVTICHRTASYTNPYVELTVDQNAIDGLAGNSGNEADHYGEHKGPLFSSSLPKHTEWGDIIPAITGVHSGQNLADGGQALLENGCTVAVELEVEVAACVIGDSTNGSLTIWVYGSAKGSKVSVIMGEDDIATFNNVNENTDMPLQVTGLGAGDYTVTLTKGNDDPISKTVSIEECDAVEIPLPVPTVDNPCGARNAAWVVPVDTDQYTWELTEGNELVVTTIPPYVFPNEKNSYNYGTPEDDNEPCVVPCTVSNMVYVTMWITDGEEMPVAGAWPEDGVPATFKFTVEGLELSTQEVESYVYGLINGGYTKLVDVEEMSYKTFRFADSTGNSQVVTAYILNVDLDGDITTIGDQTYFFYEPIYNGVVQDEIWQTWDVYNSGNAVIWGNGSGDPVQSWNSVLASYPNAVVLNYGFNQGTYNQGTHAMVQDIVFDCATVRFSVAPPTTPGEVLGDTAVKPAPVASTPQVLPATLPATGQSESNFGIVLGIVFSALTYFAMMRRQQEA